MNISKLVEPTLLISTEIIVVSRELMLPEYSLGPLIEAAKTKALVLAATISSCATSEENKKLAEAQIELTKVSRALEKQREALKSPLLEAGRRLDRMVKTAVEPIDKALGRLSELNSEWVIAERRRVQEEDRLRQAEIDRIERERLAEIARVQAEQDAANERARLAQEAADRAAREATTKAEKARAVKAQAEADERARIAQEQAAQSVVEIARVEAAASEATRIESKQTKPEKVAGQVSRNDWEITVLDIWKVVKYRPDLVSLTLKLVETKAALNDGMVIQGITARAIVKGSVRIGQDRAIEV